MMADAVDEHEHRFGVRREGLFFSGLTLAVKAASGIGGLVAGVALDAIGFPAKIASKGADLHLSPDLVRNLGLVGGPLPAAITLLAPLVLLAYTLTKARHQAILADLGRSGSASS
jgi:GPH family glycoside/pentoside/hexuronide:cation symporter